MVLGAQKNRDRVAWVIISFVMDKYDVNVFENTRKKEVIDARRTAIHLLYIYTRLSVTEIGKLFDQDHSTVTHANQVLRSECLQYPDIRERVIRDETEIECLLQNI